MESAGLPEHPRAVTSEEITTFGQMLHGGQNAESLLRDFFERVYGSMKLFSSLTQKLVSELDRIRRDIGESELYEMLSVGALNTSLWYDFYGVQKWFVQECGMLAEKKTQQLSNPSAKAIQGIDLIRKNYNKDLSLDWVADHLGISAVYLLQLLKREKGKTFTELLTQYRMEAAADMILQGRYKTQDLAERVGYHSSQYFHTAFKKYYGCTPKEYWHMGGKANKSGENRQ